MKLALKMRWYKVPQSLDQTTTQSFTLWLHLCTERVPCSAGTAVVVLLRALQTALETIPRVLEKRCFLGVPCMIWKGGLTPCADESFVSIGEVCLVRFYQHTSLSKTFVFYLTIKLKCNEPKM